MLENGVLQCGYHGLEFDGKGACTHNPHGDCKIPKAAVVRSFAVVERHTAVWIWMGDPKRADVNRIPDYSRLSLTPEDGYRTIRGSFIVECAYELEIDNLMDLSHPQFLHPSSLGSSAQSSAEYKAWQEGDTTVHSNRWFMEGPCPPSFAINFPVDGKPVEHWIEMRWDAPSLLMLQTGVTLTGQPREKGLNTWVGHLLTPETAATTHYFWTFTRRYKLDSEEADEGHRGRLIGVFVGEDKPMLEAIQQYMGDRSLWDLKPVLLPGDAGGVRARRLLEKLIADERAAVEVDNATA